MRDAVENKERWKRRVLGRKRSSPPTQSSQLVLTCAEALLEVGLDGALDRGQRVMTVREVAGSGLDGERFEAWRGRLYPEEMPRDYETRRGGPHVAATNDTRNTHSQQKVVSNIMRNLLAIKN